MATRPFYVGVDIEGRETMLKGGPRSRYGSVHINLNQRDKGGITTPFTVDQFSQTIDGKLMLVTVVRKFGEEVSRHETEY